MVTEEACLSLVSINMEGFPLFFQQPSRGSERLRDSFHATQQKRGRSELEPTHLCPGTASALCRNVLPSPTPLCSTLLSAHHSNPAALRLLYPTPRSLHKPFLLFLEPLLTAAKGISVVRGCHLVSLRSIAATSLPGAEQP